MYYFAFCESNKALKMSLQRAKTTLSYQCFHTSGLLKHFSFITRALGQTKEIVFLRLPDRP